MTPLYFDIAPWIDYYRGRTVSISWINSRERFTRSYNAAVCCSRIASLQAPYTSQIRLSGNLTVAGLLRELKKKRR